MSTPTTAWSAARSRAGRLKWAVLRGRLRVRASAQALTHPLVAQRVGWDRGVMGSYPELAEEYRRRLGWLVAGIVGAGAASMRNRSVAMTSAALAGGLIASRRVAERPSRGARARWPGGRLTDLPAVALDRDLLRREFAARGPVVKTSAGTRKVAAVLGLARGAALLQEHRDRLSSIGYPLSALIPKRFVRDMDPEDHAHYRLTLGSAFSPARMRALEPELRAMVDEDVAAHRRTGAPLAVAAWTNDLLLRMWLRILFGFVATPLELQWFRTQYLRFEWRSHIRGAPHELAAFAAVADDLTGRIDAWRGHDSALWPECVAASLLRDDPAALDDPNMLGNLVMLTATTSVDTHGLVKWALHFVTDGGWQRRLRADLHEQADGGDLADRIISETLRLEQSEALHRRITDDIEHEGFMFPKGWELRVCVTESHRDPTVFPNPDRFDPDRFKGRRYARDQYAPFGLDNHSCIGETLARMATRVILERLVLAADWEVSRAFPIAFGEWRHWAPDSRWEIRLVPIASGETAATGG